MPARTRFTLEQLNAKAKQRIAEFQTNGRDLAAAAEAAVASLLGDLFTLREKNRELKENAGTGADPKNDRRVHDLERELEDAQQEADRLRTQLPAAGAAVLTGDDATAWTAFRAFLTAQKIELKDAGTKLEALARDRETLASRVSEHEFAALTADAAEAMQHTALGKMKPNILRDRLTSDNLYVELRDDTRKKLGKDGKETAETHVVKIPFVRPKDKPGDPLVALDKHIENTPIWKDYLPALRVSESESTSGTGNQSGVRFPALPGDTSRKNSPSAPNAVKGYLDSAYASPGQIKEQRQQRAAGAANTGGG